MPTIADLFTQREVLDYTRDRTPKPMMGETLFPARKIQGLEFDYLQGGSSLPVAAKVHAFDTEAEIGSREATKGAAELALVKRKMQLKEKDIIALTNPRNSAEQQYLMQRVYNDLDNLVLSVRARHERMRMELLATGKVTLDESNDKAVVDYKVPDDHKATSNWASDDVNPLDDILNWTDKMDSAPTRALTSTKLLRLLMRNKNVLASIYGRDTGKVLTLAELDQYMEANNLPVIRTYDAKYRTQDGQKYTKHRYWNEDAFAMFDDQLLGETVYGPTAEEIKLTANPEFETGLVGNIFTTVYETSGDPVATFEKAVATALPSFAAADDVFQATITTTVDGGSTQNEKLVSQNVDHSDEEEPEEH